MIQKLRRASTKNKANNIRNETGTMLPIFIAPHSLSGQIYDGAYIINHFPRRRFKYIFISEPDVQLPT